MIAEKEWSALFLPNTVLRQVEPDIYSVLPNNETGNEYDGQFGFIYDLIACNWIYNRLIWGYSVKIFSRVAEEALQATTEGTMLDLGCGSLAFTARTYCRYPERPVILADQSLKMLRMAKSKLIQLKGKVPDNLTLLHADALQLPFQEKTFRTVLSENLLHCLPDTGVLLKRLDKIIANDGKMIFTTLVKTNRLADKYLQALADSGKLVPRTPADHQESFAHMGLSAEYEIIGNILLIYYNRH